MARRRFYMTMVGFGQCLIQDVSITWEAGDMMGHCAAFYITYPSSFQGCSFYCQGQDIIERIYVRITGETKMACEIII